MTVFFYSSIVFVSIYFFYIDQITREKYQTHLILILFIFLIIITSFRWEVGGDWASYYLLSKLEYSEYLNRISWSPVFVTINYVSSKVGLGIFGVNLFVSIFLFFSFYLFSKTFNLNILLLLPILITVIYVLVLMGYVRQCLALSFFFLFLQSLKEGNIFKSCIILVFGGMSHVTILFFFPIILPLIQKKIFYGVKALAFFLITISILIFYLFLNFNDIYTSYGIFVRGSQYTSEGVIFRFIPSICVAIYFIYFKKEIMRKYLYLNFFFNFSFFIIIIFSGLILFGNNLSTLVDRLSIYNFAFYSIIISTVYKILKDKNKNFHILFISFVYSLHLTLFLSWLILGDYSVFWTNYNFLQ